MISKMHKDSQKLIPNIKTPEGRRLSKSQTFTKLQVILYKNMLISNPHLLSKVSAYVNFSHYLSPSSHQSSLKIMKRIHTNLSQLQPTLIYKCTENSMHVLTVRIINPQYLTTQTLFHLFCLICLVHESHHVQVDNCLSIEVKIAIIDSWSAWESLRNQIFFIPGLLGAHLLFLLYSLLFQCFKAHRKARLGEVNQL